MAMQHQVDGAADARMGPLVRLRQLLIEVAVIAAVFIAYRQIRLITADQLVDARSNALRIIDLERTLHIFNEHTVQQLVTRSQGLVLFLNRYYVTVHFPATALFLAWLYIRHGAHYRRIRNWFVAVTAVALAVHIAFPLAPPRLVPGLGLVDTLQRFGPRIYSADTTTSTANQLAAMPSLHVGWAFMVAASFAMVKRTRRSLLLMAHPAITLLAVVATANHYWLDAACAVLLAGAVWSVARLWVPANPAVAPARRCGPGTAARGPAALAPAVTTARSEGAMAAIDLRGPAAPAGATPAVALAGRCPGTDR